MLVDQARIPVDKSRVFLALETEVRYWCARFNVHADELHAAVGAVGNDVYDVERRLKQAARRAFDKTGED